MPPDGKLSDQEIATLREWVRLGAPWPIDPQPATPQAQKRPGYTKGQREFWSLRPIAPVTPPAVHDESWVRTPVDRFVLARLEAAGLRPAPPADKRVLIRRATLDLTGLLPTEDEVRAFEADGSTEAFQKVDG